MMPFGWWPSRKAWPEAKQTSLVAMLFFCMGPVQKERQAFLAGLELSKILTFLSFRAFVIPLPVCCTSQCGLEMISPPPPGCPGSLLPAPGPQVFPPLSSHSWRMVSTQGSAASVPRYNGGWMLHGDNSGGLFMCVGMCVTCVYICVCACTNVCTCM